ncbi:hypothetical protein RER_pREC1-00860 (plasmid) [Rhodococcus erythropolis PR4]|uniref:Uncharacterized protein n=2 Tax=Rhodococcus erythropolis TaxID=1833 RepID=Q3L8Y6_RHOE4|nr:hypothetical protein RER_pREC1-00860 [Rhodococcus erythropolis PR4]
MHLSPTDTDSGRLRESEYLMTLGIIGTVLAIPVFILAVVALYRLAWLLFAGGPGNRPSREQKDWLIGEGHKDRASIGAVGQYSAVDSGTGSTEFEPVAVTNSGYNDYGLDPDEYQELVNIDSPSNTALVRVTAFEAEHCAMIIGAYAQGQTAYEEAVNDVRFFLLAASFSARHPNSIRSAESLASRREAVMKWPYPRPGGPRSQPE